MTYNTADQSTHDGAPIHLVQFDYLSTTWRYCTAPNDFNDGTNTRTAEPISGLDEIDTSENVEDANS